MTSWRTRIARWAPWGAVPEVEPRPLAELLRLETAPFLLDVRSEVEFRRSRIPGAVHVPLHALAQRLPALPLAPERRVVAICLSAHRSIPAVRHLQARGHLDTAQLRGGMLAWWRAGLPTVTGD